MHTQLEIETHEAIVLTASYIKREHFRVLKCVYRSLSRIATNKVFAAKRKLRSYTFKI